MNALHLNSEREAMANSRRIVPENQASAAERNQAKPHVVSINKIALDRIASIKVMRSGYPEYHLHTTIDFEGFRESYGGARFMWSPERGEWLLVDQLKDLEAAIVKIKA